MLLREHKVHKVPKGLKVFKVQ
jgi:5-bromo-4-chloroindolyl phosphate hydrolysis protein